MRLSDVFTIDPDLIHRLYPTLGDYADEVEDIFPGVTIGYPATLADCYDDGMEPEACAITLMDAAFHEHYVEGGI